MPVHEHQDLPRIAIFGELLGPAVHVSDDRLGANDPFAIQLQNHPQHAVRGGVLRTDVEDHLLGPQWPFGHHVDAPASKHPGVAGGGVRRPLLGLQVHRLQGNRGIS